MKLSEFAQLVDGQLAYGEDFEVEGFAPIHAVGEGLERHLGFLLPQRQPNELLASDVGAVLVTALPPRLEDEPALKAKSFLVVPNPELAFARILAHVHPRPVATEQQVHPTAVVAEGVEFEGPVRVEARAVIEAGVRIGAGSVIGAGVFVGRDAKLGKDCLLHPNATIMHGSVLGHRVVVHSCAVIGGDGFGFALDAQQRWVKLEQIGRCILEDDVEIGSNTSVHRGAIYDTIVRRGTKIDSQAHIGHNCDIGEDCVLAGGSSIAGSTKIGHRCRLGGLTGVSGHIEITHDVVLAARAGVMQGIAKPGVYAGQPALPIRERRRLFVEERRLLDYRRRIRELEQRLNEWECSSD
ncbi:MAG: UDP-3-O-(3-hydroxymyristoyl)glucosamine N-acyltransferase [Planctomycetota bacterium]|nr:MAG: UDP-3-O-(3-hydroxymyristoyl)glucosamine N-acyltransferase [Planctomycetota bacterium]